MTFVLEASGDRWTVAAPLRGEQPWLPLVGERLWVHIPTAVRAYRFEAQVIAANEAPFPSLAFHRIGAPLPIQRRQFVRVKVLYPVRAWTREEGEPLDWIGVDLSAGGAGLWAPRRGEMGLHLHLCLGLHLLLPSVPEEGEPSWDFQVRGKIVRFEECPRAWRLGVLFLNMPLALQERLVRWCFAVQRRLLRRGLLRREG